MDVLKHIVLMLVLRHMKPSRRPTATSTPTAAPAATRSRAATRRRRASTSAASVASGPGPTCPRSSPTTSRGAPLSIPRGAGQYPGSPALAQLLLRPQDQLRAFELHPTEQKILRATLAATPDAIAYDGDGFAGLKSQLPPSSRRAAVLIDPSYEGNGDYGRVVATLREALARFADGVYMVWYPQVSKLEAASLPKRLEALAPKSWLHARLSVQQPDAQGFGLAGSGMFVINPPHSLAAQLQGVLPWLVDVLGQYDGAQFGLDRLDA